MKAEKHRWKTRLLFYYARRQMKKQFFSVRLYADLESLADASNFPLVLFGNHHYWWDGLMETLLFDQFHLDYYIMMEEKNLRKFPYFQKTGVYGVDLESKSGRAEALLYSARLLKANSPRRTLLMYPQGKLVSVLDPQQPPFASGLSGLLRLLPHVKARPLAKQIVPGKRPKPEVFLRIGPPVDSSESIPPDNPLLESSLETTMNQLRKDILADSELDAHWLIPPPKKYRGNAD